MSIYTIQQCLNHKNVGHQVTIKISDYAEEIQQDVIDAVV